MPPRERQRRDWLHFQVTEPTIKLRRFHPYNAIPLVIFNGAITPTFAPMALERGHAPFLTCELP
jgi:hypothetical protein